MTQPGSPTAFEDLVEHYDAARPSYPQALYDELGALGDCLELGAGTGIASTDLAKQGSLTSRPEKGFSGRSDRRAVRHQTVEVQEAMKALRTPDFDVSDFPWETRYAETHDGLRMAYVDEGSGPVVLLLHGEPSWSYLYRTMIPVFLAAGCRVVAPDLIGFGRSDKPTEIEDYSYAGHIAWLKSVVLETLDLTDITLVCQDWGGLLGIRMATENLDRFARICAANTGLPDGHHRLPEEWWAFRNFVERTPDLPIGFLVSAAVVTPMTAEVQAAYDAPFPDASYKAGARAFPDLIPQDPDNPATPAQQRAWEVLEQWPKPFLCAFSDSDPITRGGDKPFLQRVPGCIDQPHTVIEGGGHFLQEDKGPELARVVVDWMFAS